jgi:hypothetical protein
MRHLLALAIALVVTPGAQAAFVDQHPEEGYTSRTIDINAATAAITVRRHFTVNATEPAYVWFDPWTADSVAAGYRVAYALGPADAQGALASVLLANGDVRNTDTSATATLKPGTTYVLQFTVTYPPVAQRSSTTNSFVGIVALKEGQGTEGSGGILDPSLGTRLDVTFTGTVSTPPPTTPPPRPTPQPAPEPVPQPPPPGPQPVPEIHITNEFQVPLWLVGLLVLVCLFSLLGLFRRRRRDDPAPPPATAPFALHEAGPFILRDDPFWDAGGPPKRM